MTEGRRMRSPLPSLVVSRSELEIGTSLQAWNAQQRGLNVTRCGRCPPHSTIYWVLIPYIRVTGSSHSGLPTEWSHYEELLTGEPNGRLDLREELPSEVRRSAAHYVEMKTLTAWHSYESETASNWGGPTPLQPLMSTLSLCCAISNLQRSTDLEFGSRHHKAREGRPHSPSLGHPCPGAGSSFTQREVPLRLGICSASNAARRVVGPRRGYHPSWP